MYSNKEKQVKNRIIFENEELSNLIKDVIILYIFLTNILYRQQFQKMHHDINNDINTIIHI